MNAIPGTIKGISFPDASCDVVFLDEIVRVLQPGGILYINTWVIDDPTTVEAAFGMDWRRDRNLDLTAHTTIYPTRLLLDQLQRRGLIPQMEIGTWLAGQGQGAHAIQFCDFLAQKKI